ncbi:AraC family transcriptional regulator [Motiliproteus coralliicola]|uniref:AraC family transcriptional regulator n=1 Tax=Motiliproteus coralliicola TaxID=2283196 RepID=UPI001FB37401|nr:helix-turn-helix domain-containing protein [Motiliproteus coralliicola]
MFVQAIWSASVQQSESGSIAKWLYSDAGSGIIFNLVGGLSIAGVPLPEGVIMLPVSKQAANISLPSGARLAGIRFHPAIGYGVTGQHYDKPTLLPPSEDHQFNLYNTFAELRQQLRPQSHLETIHRWAEQHLGKSQMIPDALDRAMQQIEQQEMVGRVAELSTLSLRQIERLFQHRLDMTPKHYQRILRIRKAIHYLQQHSKANLAEVAQQFGFSDQAHMTREFRAIASTTPTKISPSSLRPQPSELQGEADSNQRTDLLADQRRSKIG